VVLSDPLQLYAHNCSIAGFANVLLVLVDADAIPIADNAPGPSVTNRSVHRLSWPRHP